MSVKEKVCLYFKCGYPYKDIIELLQKFDGTVISIRTLHRILRESGLKRRSFQLSTKEIVEHVRREIDKGENRGYRSIYTRLINSGIQISSNTVRLAIKEIDPCGVEERLSKRLKRRKYRTNGPNEVWHIDGNDKLKPFGFCIHGCIDGFSRKMIWLEVSDTNKDPYVIASYFTESIKKLSLVPQKVRGDKGTENVNVCGIQRFLRRDHLDQSSGYNSFLYGKSVSNQRIEQWWSHLKRHTTQSWIDYFKDMRDIGTYDDTNKIHVEALKFCYYGVIKNELNNVKNDWNHHKIRKSRHAESPCGRPDLMYYLPHNYGGENQGFQINNHELDISIESYTRKPKPMPCQEAFIELAQMVMNEQNLLYANSRDEAEQLYYKLISEIEIL